MPNRQRLFFYCLFLLTVSLSGCGFKLRGSHDIPPAMSPAYVETQGSSQLHQALLQVLRSSGVSMTTDRPQAKMILKIHSTRQDSRVATVDAGGKVLETELLFQADFAAQRADGTELAPRQTVNLTRTFFNPEVEVLGKQEEEAVIYAEMIDDVANRIVRRLVTQLR